jgi:signal transduction histidine kinase/CheY-like chemotaxis protein
MIGGDAPVSENGEPIQVDVLLRGLPQPVAVMNRLGAVEFANQPAVVLFELAIDEPRLVRGPLADQLIEVGLVAAAANGRWEGVIPLPGTPEQGGDDDVVVTVTRLELDGAQRFVVTAAIVPVARQSEDRARLLAAVVEQSTEFIAWHGPLSAEPRINPAGAAMVGANVRAEVPLPGRIRDLFIPESSAVIDEIGAPEMHRTGAWRGPIQVRNHDTGEVRDLDWAQFLVRGDDGRLLGTAGMGRDVTEHKQAEAAVHAARADAEQANRAKSDFISRMSHELRTPLTAILGFGELLEDCHLADDERELVAHIVSAGRHLLDMINELLDISAIEAGRLRLSLERVHVGQVVSEVLAMIAPIAATKEITLTAADPDPHHVRADRQRLKQIVLNLVANAVKYNRPGGAVRIAVKPLEGQRIQIVVDDTGFGIADDDLRHLFQPFERFGDKQTEIEGTGLGLALTKGLVGAMGGQIGAESRLDIGSRFWIELEESAPAATKSMPADVAPEAETSVRPARTLLYIDDNLVNIELVARILRRRPEITLLTATDGETGLELARAKRPALVLLDLNLPRMSGQEVLLRLRSEPETAAMPIIVLSGDASPHNITALRDVGATDYLTKPYQISELLALVDSTGIEPPNL